MCIRQVLILFALLASCTISIDAEQRVLVSEQRTVDRARSLRAAESTNNEERIMTEIIKRLRTATWIETGRTDDYVKTTLRLDNLFGAALKSAPNYMYYEHFLNALEGRILEVWLSKGVPTKNVWATYKLDDIPTAQLNDNDGFKTYLRYAIMEDNKIFKLKSNDQPVAIDYSGTPAELKAKVDMWVSLKRPNYYVSRMLDLDRRSINTFRRSPKFQLYEMFQMKTWAAKGYPTNYFWKDHRLHEVPQQQLQNNGLYKKFVRYAMMVDDESFKNGKTVKITADESKAEISTKVTIWASKDRPFEYVKKVLGLRGAADTTNANYKYFEDFLLQTNRPKKSK
ncbi:hypothetical protein GN244_ATG15558 [Phytophthora infestans]|uniref:Secreted RxLR effector peptide protein n=1 Tax=Phytophthora infestans TaxID=4787 RepID=A0A833W7D8_PHYIN|nr:hypothetical protein GN244_ATG15558 [Phytophthora infestans]KAF4135993.1 hypothetical protein GN958_ATG14808 [Phytophthora infestans]